MVFSVLEGSKPREWFLVISTGKIQVPPSPPPSRSLPTFNLQKVVSSVFHPGPVWTIRAASTTLTPALTGRLYGPPSLRGSRRARPHETRRLSHSSLCPALSMCARNPGSKCRKPRKLIRPHSQQYYPCRQHQIMYHFMIRFIKPLFFFPGKVDQSVAFSRC